MTATHIARKGKLGALLLPKEIFRDHRLKPSGIRFLVTLIEFRNGKTGKTILGGASIEELTSISASNQNRTIKHLVELGWLKYHSGNHSQSNEYTVSIPDEGEYGFTYARRTKTRLSDGDWADEVERRKQGISKYVRNSIRGAADFWAMSEEDLILEMAEESAVGQRWIPDEYLDNFGLVRDGDNSDSARELRRGIPPQVRQGEQVTEDKSLPGKLASAPAAVTKDDASQVNAVVDVRTSPKQLTQASTRHRSLRSRWRSLANAFRFWNRP